MHISFTHLTAAGVVGDVSERIAQSRYDHPLTVVTPNVEQLIQSRHDRQFLADLQAADIRIPDSVGLVWADWWRAAVTGRPWNLHQRVTGVDIAEKLIAEASEHGWKVVVIGGLDNSATEAAENLKKRFHGLKIWGIEVGQITDQSPITNHQSLITNINQLHPDLLFVGLGAPKQERWIMQHRDQLQVQMVMVVGGAIDMWAARLQRAPMWMRRFGTEWLYRLIQEPWRWKRQLRLLEFSLAVLRRDW